MINRNKSCIWICICVLADALDLRLIETRVVFELVNINLPVGVLVWLIETRVVFEFKASYQAGTGKTWLIETRVVFEYGRCRAYNIA